MSNEKIGYKTPILATLGLIAYVVFNLIMFSVATSFLTAASDVQVALGISAIAIMLLEHVVLAVWGYNKYKATPVAMLIVALLFSACTTVEPGYVGIKVNKAGSNKGVEDLPLVTGYVWYNPFTEDVYEYPTFMQQQSWTKDPLEGSPNNDEISFNSVEGSIVYADIALSYSFEPTKVPQIFKDFRQDARTLTGGYIRSQIRDAFGRHSGEYKAVALFGEKRAEFLAIVEKDIKDTLSPRGIIVDKISIIGSLRASDSVMSSINAVIQSAQKAIEAENKIRESKALADQKIEAARGEAESLLAVAESKAKANRLLTASLSKELLQWESIAVQRAAIEKWTGVMPTYTGGAVPFIQLNNTKPSID